MKCHFNIIECPLKFILTPGEKIVNFPLCEVVKKNQNDKGRTLSWKKGRTSHTGLIRQLKIAEINMVNKKKMMSPLEKCNSKLYWKSIPFQIRIAIIRNLSGNKCWWGCWENETLFSWDWDFELLQMPEISTVVPQNLNSNYHMTQSYSS